MFSSLGLFKNISCPYEDGCSLEHCLFSHAPKVTSEQSTQTTENSDKIATPNSKKRKLDDRSTEPRHETHSHSSRLNHQLSTVPANQPRQLGNNKATHKPKSAIHTTGISQKRPVSPPPLKRTHLASTSLATEPKRLEKESLNPRKIQAPPAGHSTRTLYLKKLHENFKELNHKLAASGAPDSKHLELSENELVTLALDEEEKAASENANIYANVIKNRILSLTRMTLDKWKLERQEAKSKTQANREKPIITDLSQAREIEVLHHLTAENQRLSQYGFVLSAPTDLEVAKAKDGSDAALGWELCDRCKSRFQVFPLGQREDGTLTSGGVCTYHPGRIEVGLNQKAGTDHKFYRCCNAPVGSSFGCSTADCHVFKVEGSARLATTWQFEETPPNDKARPAISFDCEMGFTVNGMELIRLTALSWPEGELLLDVLVKPFGEILDLNTRFSGVRKGDFDNTVPYGSEDGTLTGESKLRMVESPTDARELFYRLISPSTILVGHSLENDLNATRIVHKNIADSAILFPHRRGAPFRLALKMIAKETLGRDIQLGSDGHDAQEDAKTAGDLVRTKVATKWKQMQKDGWTFQEDRLVSPTERMKQMIGKPLP